MVKEMRPTWLDVLEYICVLINNEEGSHVFDDITVDYWATVCKYPYVVCFKNKDVFEANLTNVYRYNYGSWANKLKALYLEKTKEERLEIESRFADLEE